MEKNEGNKLFRSPFPLSAEHFIRCYGFNPNRKKILESFANWADAVLSEGFKIVSLWVGGSFTTLKQNPGDIDVFITVTDSKKRNQQQVMP